MSEVYCGPITDDYSLDDADAEELLRAWLRRLPDERTEALFGPGRASIS